MKRVLTTALVAAFALSIVGCRASAEVEGDDSAGGSSSYKKTSTVDRDGDRTIRTEKKMDRD